MPETRFGPIPRKSTVVPVGSTHIGGGGFTVIAGPCAIESLEQFRASATSVQKDGATILRGGIFKMRTRPESFQGLGASGWDLVKQIKSLTHMPFISEITDPRQISDMLGLVDIFQVGSRNMYNYAL